jgi:biopolymer transport protein ExbB/TolQ
MDIYSGSHLIVFGAYALFLLLAVGVVLVLWIFMPFSVFGLKGQIRKLTEEQQRTNELLASLVRSSRERSAIPEPPLLAPAPSAGEPWAAHDIKDPGAATEEDRGTGFNGDRGGL